jgi:hypothetical protein
VNDVQGDLFAPEPEVEEPPHQEPEIPWGQVHPSPLDGLVHQVIAQTTDRGARLLTVKCGAKMPRYRQWEPLAGGTLWPHLVTCEPCQPTAAGVVQAAFEAMVAENYANRPAAKAAKKKETQP